MSDYEFCQELCDIVNSWVDRLNLIIAIRSYWWNPES